MANRDDDRRLDAPVFHRNNQAVATVLQSIFGDATGDILEIGSGTGQHAVVFSRALPGYRWWPTDYETRHIISIAAWRDQDGGANLQSPVQLDAGASDWRLGTPGRPPGTGLAGVVSLNVVHISPWPVALGILQGAGQCLKPGGLMVFYGPFKRGGRHVSDSNAAFDNQLRRENQAWGVRDIDDIEAAGFDPGLDLIDVIAMPNNNFTVVLRKS